MDNNKKISYVEFSLILLQKQVKELRNSKPLMNSRLTIYLASANIQFEAFASIAHSFDEENTISPPEFMKWYQDNYNRMVEKGIRPPLSEEEICSGAFSKSYTVGYSF